MEQKKRGHYSKGGMYIVCKDGRRSYAGPERVKLAKEIRAMADDILGQEPSEPAIKTALREAGII